MGDKVELAYLDYISKLNAEKKNLDIYIYSRDQIGDISTSLANSLLNLGIRMDFNIERSERQNNWFAYIAVLKAGILEFEEHSIKSVKVEYEDESVSLISTRWHSKYKNLPPIAIDKKSGINLYPGLNEFRGLLFVIYRDGKFVEQRGFDVSWQSQQNQMVTRQFSTTTADVQNRLKEDYFSGLGIEFDNGRQQIENLIIKRKFAEALSVISVCIDMNKMIYNDWLYEYYLALLIKQGRTEDADTWVNQNNLLTDQSRIFKYWQKYDYKHMVEKLLIDNWLTNHMPEITEVADNIKSDDTERFSSYPIFVYWGQGFDNAPDLVQAAYRQLKNVVPEDALVTLSETNIKDYIDIPEVVVRIRESHWANYSDYIRMALLAKYGGAWVDATVFVSHSFYKELQNFNSEPSNYPMDGPIAVMGSWFRAYKQSSHLGERMLQASVVLWLTYFNSIPFYFFLDFLEQYWSDYNVDSDKPINSFYWPNRGSAFAIRNKMDTKYDVDWTKHTLSLSPVHKLNYKLENWEKLNQPESLYQAIINDRLSSLN